MSPLYQDFLKSIPKDPLPYFTLGFTAAIFSHFSIPSPTIYSILVSAILLIVTYRYKTTLWGYVIYIFNSGFISALLLCLYYSSFSYYEDTLSHTTKIQDHQAEIIKIMDRGQKTYFYVSLTPPIQEHIEKVRLIAPKNHKSFLPQDTINIKASLYPLPKGNFKGDYDFSFYAKTHHIQAIGRIYNASLMHRPSYSLYGFMQEIRNKIEASLHQHLPPEQAAITSAMSTGNRSILPQMIQDQWKNTGIFHLLSISGLHMTVIASLAFFTCRRLLFICPPIIRHYDTKKISAFLAIIMAYFYYF